MEIFKNNISVTACSLWNV